jgi:DNA-binding transcriptional ArsR family regulator
MINKSYQRFFKTLANENRLKIVSFLLREQAQSVSEIVKGTRLEQTLVSHNLKRLLECHFVEVERVGKERVYSLNRGTIEPLLSLMNQHVNTYCANCKLNEHE